METSQAANRVAHSKSSFWEEQILEWKTSGLSPKQFCLDRDLKLPTFYWWRQKLGQKKKLFKPIFLPVTLQQTTIEESDPTSGIRIELPDKFSITLSKQFDQETLLRLLQTLERR